MIVIDLEKDLEKVKNLYLKKKFSQMDISKKLGLPLSRVRKILEHGNVKARGPIETRRLKGEDMGAHLRGKKKKPMSDATKKKLSKAKTGKGKGVSQKATGYVTYTAGKHKYRSVHIVKMEEMIGRRLIYKKECVHHIDGDKSNNDINNLAFMTTKAHARLHRFEDKLKGKQRKRNKKGRFL